MISKIGLHELERFNELGLMINKNFSNVYILSDIIKSNFDEVYGFYQDDRLIGFIHILRMYETLDIVNVVVDTEYRNRGVGSALLNYVIGLYEDVNSIMLEVNVNNTAAVSLYEKCGFEVINRRNNYYGSDAALIMKRVVENERC